MSKDNKHQLNLDFLRSAQEQKEIATRLLNSYRYDYPKYFDHVSMFFENEKDIEDVIAEAYTRAFDVKDLSVGDSVQYYMLSMMYEVIEERLLIEDRVNHTRYNSKYDKREDNLIDRDELTVAIYASLLSKLKSMDIDSVDNVFDYMTGDIDGLQKGVRDELAQDVNLQILNELSQQ